MAPPSLSHPSKHEVNASIDAHSSTALATARRNLTYLFNPSTAPTSPGRLRTRALLRSFHYIGVFFFWRIVRYAKYALAAAAVAAVSATTLGSVVSGAAFVVAPTGIAASAGLGLVYAVGRWGFRLARGRVMAGRQKVVVGAAAKGGSGTPEPRFLKDTFE